MPLETGNFISDLVATNPPGTDDRSTADDHLRLIKHVLKTTFPNLNGAVNPTPAEMNTLVGANTAGTALTTADTGAGKGLDADTVDGFDARILVPAGIIQAFAGSVAPAGWLECNGAAISRTTYVDLFAAIGTTFGIGDGSTTFNLPDLRGEFIRGWDNGRGIDTGRGLGTFQVDDVKPHTHTGTTNSSGAHNHTVSVPAYSNVYAASTNGATTGTSAVATTSTNGAHTHTFTTNNNNGVETRPRNISLMYIIKY